MGKKVARNYRTRQPARFQPNSLPTQRPLPNINVDCLMPDTPMPDAPMPDVQSVIVASQYPDHDALNPASIGIYDPWLHRAVRRLEPDLPPSFTVIPFQRRFSRI
jgi:hypothetical protein